MATYYFDSVLGNDSNPTNAIATPWKSLAKVTSLTLVAGDSVLFNRGGTWIPWDSAAGRTGGAFTIGENGTSASPITFGAYGTGANPLISGFYTVPTTGWTQVGTSNVWTLRDTVHFPTTMLNVLLYNGALTPLGRFPATGYLTYTGSTGTTAISFASGILPQTYTTGEVVIRKNHWTLTRGTINTQTTTSITYTAPGTGQLTATAGYGFFIQNHQNCLTKAGDWSYNPTTQTLSMWFTSGPAGTIRISATDTLVSFAASRSYNIFSGISFEGGNSYAINGSSAAANNQINNCVFNFIGMNAIAFATPNTCTISGNTINDTLNTAVYLPDSVKSTLISNTISRTGQIAGAGQSGDGPNGFGAHAAILISNTSTASGNIVKTNTVLSSGHAGIYIMGESFLVDNNYVDTACNVVDDGGCIYTTVGTGGAHAYVGRTISNNVLLNSVGAPAGTTGFNWGNGLMCDDNSSNLTLFNNTVYNCGQYGIYHHNNHEIVCINNLSYNNALAQFAIQQDPGAVNAPPAVNFTVSGNEFLAVSATQLCIRFRALLPTSTQADFINFGICDDNYYSSLFSNFNLLSTQLPSVSEVFRDLPGWQSYTTKDINSTMALPYRTAYGVIIRPQNRPLL